MSLKVEWHSQIPQYAQNLAGAIDPGVEQAAAYIAEQARDTVRVDTASLKETIDHERVEQSMGKSEYSVNAGDTSGGYKGGATRKEGSPVDYALGQEYGPGEHTPYLTPAAEEGWQKFIDIMTTRIASTRV